MTDERDVAVFEEDADIITLEFEDGEVECEMVGVFEANGKEYLALIPEGEESYWLFGYKEAGEDEFEIIDIEDDAEFEAAEKAFYEIMGIED